jgi:hypothetical protein
MVTVMVLVVVMLAEMLFKMSAVRVTMTGMMKILGIGPIRN